MQPLRALRAVRRLIADKEDTVQVFEIMRALAGKAIPKGYRRLLTAARGVDGCVGLHLCGAYLKNRRRRGLRNEDESPDVEAIAAIRQANRETAQWMAAFEDPSFPPGAAP